MRPADARGLIIPRARRRRIAARTLRTLIPAPVSRPHDKSVASRWTWSVVARTLLPRCFGGASAAWELEDARTHSMHVRLHARYTRARRIKTSHAGRTGFTHATRPLCIRGCGMGLLRVNSTRSV